MTRFNARILSLPAAIVLGLLMLTWAGGGAMASSTTEGDFSAAADSAELAPVLDHYWCYSTTSTPVNENVELQDQFNTALVPATVGAPERFCTPAKKKHGDKTFKIVDANAHLIFYKIGTPAFKLLNVEVKNQFGTQQLKVFAPAIYLAVPTTLVGTPAPASLDHFKCYKVKGPNSGAIIGLKDKFNTAPNLVVARPVLLCNPTIKVHGAQQFPIQHPEAHLVCYKVTKIQFSGIINTINQFRAEPLTIENPNMMCAPSKKTILD